MGWGKHIEPVNLTPHEINIILSLKNMQDCKITLPPAETPARVTQEDVEVKRYTVTDNNNLDRINALPIVESQFGEVENLPEPKKGVGYIVSRVVAEACPERNDLFIPAKTVRDSEGQIIGCRALAQLN